MKNRLQDTCIHKNNVILESLGAPGYTWDRIQRIRRIKNKCRSIDNQYDVLIVRGMTPRQNTIWKNIKAKNKIFLF